jgi:Immunity protein Imm5
MVLQEMIEEGLLLVQGDPQHDLKLGFRCRLLSSFDEIDGAGSPRSGQIKRVKLAALSVGKVLPLWDSGFPADRGPHLALDVAKKLIEGTDTATAARHECRRLWRHCEDLINDHQDKVNIIMVGFGAAQVLNEALSERPVGCENVNDASTDLKNDAYDFDSSLYAAFAYADGASWESGSDKQKRLEFWTWWLTSAVTDATKD